MFVAWSAMRPIDFKMNINSITREIVSGFSTMKLVSSRSAELAVEVVDRGIASADGDRVGSGPIPKDRRPPPEIARNLFAF